MKKNSKKEKKPDLPKQTKQAPPFKMGWGVLVWLAVILISAILVSRFFPSQESADITYSEFKNQAVKGNIKEVTIRGQEIEGKFKEPYQKADRGEGRDRH